MVVRTFTKSPGSTITGGVGIENNYTEGYYFIFGFGYYSDVISDWVWKWSNYQWVNGQTSQSLGSVSVTVRSDETKGWKWVALALYRWDGEKWVLEDAVEGRWMKVV